MNVNDTNFFFIKERITELRSALFYNLGDGLLKQPTSIINILKMDEDWNLWFFINVLEHSFHDSEKKFPARLQFYRKNKPFFINISGCANIDEDNETINRIYTNTEWKVYPIAMKKMALVKLKITRIEYGGQNHPKIKWADIKKKYQQEISFLFRKSCHLLFIKNKIARDIFFACKNSILKNYSFTELIKKKQHFN